MSKFINIKEAAKRLWVSTSILCRREEIGVFVAERTPRRHLFSVRLYGAHSSKNKKLLKAVKEALQ